MFQLVADYWVSFATFALFGVLHSVAAQDGFKHWLSRRLGHFFVARFWRLIYCVASYVALYEVISVYHWDHHPDANLWLFDYPEWLWRVLLIVHLGSILMVYAAFLQSDYLEFWGLKQAWRGIVSLCGWRVAAAPPALFGSDRLEVLGVYRYTRHPMLVGGFLFLLSGGPSQNNLMFLLLYSLYMVIGGYYEERRLVRVFGDQYRRYRRRVSAFISLPYPRPAD